MPQRKPITPKDARRLALFIEKIIAPLQTTDAGRADTQHVLAKLAAIKEEK